MSRADAGTASRRDRRPAANGRNVPLPTRSWYLPEAGVVWAHVGRSRVASGQPDESLGEATIGAREERMGAQRLHAHDRAGSVAMCRNYIAGVTAGVRETPCLTRVQLA